jgi:eukaryotic-like serine/threonine-protein kinase
VAFLAMACGGDPARRARIERLLAWQNDDSFLESSPFAPLNAELTRSASEQIGTQIGPYRLIEELGSGGFGTVWLAQQERPVRREVALKIVKLGMDTKEVIARFEQERQALALMEHPSIARVFDAGATQSGRPFFVMELVRGVRITEYCDAHNLSVSERLDLFIQVCQAVQHAHQKGVIHRDLKPSNVLVTEQDGVPVPKVIDFGVAKATQERLTELTLMTQVEQRVGTPLYMSPEQAAGGLDIDTRADIYALGILLYELLTGRTPFADHDARDRSPRKPSTMISALAPETRTQLAEQRQTDGPRLISEIRGDLDWIVMKALEHERARRYESASGLAADIRRHLAHEPVLARPQSRAYQLRRLVRRNRLAFAASLAVALALLAGAIVSTWQAVRARRAESEQRVRAYAADMKAASVTLLENNLGGAKDLLLRHLPTPNEPDLRGMEWRYLWQAARGDELRTMRTDRIMTCAAFSADGQFIVAGGIQGDVRIWNATNAAAPLDLEGPKTSGATSFIAFSPAGKLFALLLDDSVAIRTTGDWQIIHQIEGRHFVVAFSPDGKTLGLGGPRGLWLYDTTTWKGEQISNRECRDSGKIMFSAHGSALAVLLAQGEPIVVWDVATRRITREFQGVEQTVGCAISPDGTHLAVGTRKGVLLLWEVATGQVLSETKAHSGWLFGLAFSSDGRVLASAGGDQKLLLWELTEAGLMPQQPSFRLRGHRNEIWNLNFSPDGQQLVTSSKDGTVKIWPAHPPPRPGISFDVGGDQLLGLASDGQTVRSLSPQGELRIWNADDGKLARSFLLPPNAASITKPNGDPPIMHEPHLFFGTTAGTLEIWNLQDGTPVRSVRLEGNQVTPLRVSNDERLLFGWDREKKSGGLWHLGSGEQLAEFQDLDEAGGWRTTRRAAFSPDGRTLAYATRDFSVKLWDTARGIETHVLRGHFWKIFKIVFAPDGQRIATSSWDSTTRLWDSATAALAVPPLTAHLAGVENVSFSPDARTIITVGGEGVVRLWNAATGAEMLAMTETVQPQTLVGEMLSADGNAITWQDPKTNRIHVLRLPTLPEIDAEIQRATD